MSKNRTTIQFDVLIKSASSDELANISNIDSFKPSPQDIDKCLRWFTQKAFTVYPTEFGLAGETTKDHFESVFRVQLVPNYGDPLKEPFLMIGILNLPEEIAHIIDTITLIRPPDLF